MANADLVLPEIGAESMDKVHRIEWLSVERDPFAGAKIKVAISKHRKGSPRRLLTVNQMNYEHWLRNKLDISYFLPPTDAAMKKFNQTGERFAMPGQIKD
mgnify:CR=1 FL=1